MIKAYRTPGVEPALLAGKRAALVPAAGAARAMFGSIPPMLDVDVPPETAREAARIADRESIAIEDALQRLTVYYRETESPPWVSPDALLLVVAVSPTAEDHIRSRDTPTTELMGRLTFYDYPTDVVRDVLGDEREE